MSSIQAPTRSALLALKDEQLVVNEAYVFLDEKRLLLAAELLRQLKQYNKLNDQLKILQIQSRQAMQATLMFHGLEGLQVYPAKSFDEVIFKHETRNFMGVTLVETQLTPQKTDDEHVIESNAHAGSAVASNTAASIPSIRVEHCRQLFADIVKQSAIVAGISGNLYRLLSEYRLTERRSRALENVILPEIKQNLSEMTQHLEELDLEDAIRVHLQAGERV
jgi:V/A-type H+-transporting ATPase subunit D